MGERKFEEALQRLEEIVAALEGGDLDLEESLAMFEEGIKLSRWCTAKLNEAEQRIEMLVQEGDEPPTRQPFEPEEKEAAVYQDGGYRTQGCLHLTLAGQVVEHAATETGIETAIEAQSDSAGLDEREAQALMPSFVSGHSQHPGR